MYIRFEGFCMFVLFWLLNLTLCEEYLVDKSPCFILHQRLMNKQDNKTEQRRKLFFFHRQVRVSTRCHDHKRTVGREGEVRMVPVQAKTVDKFVQMREQHVVLEGHVKLTEPWKSGVLEKQFRRFFYLQLSL